MPILHYSDVLLMYAETFKSFLYFGAYAVTPNKLVAPTPNVAVSVNKIDQNPGY